jgi:hypothetical protein
MSDEQKSLEIKITTPYDGTGAQAANSDLSKTAGAAGKAAPEIKELGKETENTKEEFRLFHEEGAEMRRIIIELDRISPSLGEAFRVMRSPIGGTLAAAIGLFVEMKSYIAETNQALDEMAKTAANADFLAGIEDKIKVFGDASAAAQGYADKLADIASGEQSVSDKLKQELALDEAIERARAELVSAQKGLAIAKIQADEESGKITPGQAAQARADIEKKAIADEQAAREADQDKKVAEDQKALADAQAQAAALAAATKAARDKETADEAHRAGLNADFGDTKKDTDLQADIQKELDEALANQEAVRKQAFGVHGTHDSAQAQNERDADLAVERAQARMQLLRRGEAQARAANDPAAIQKEKDATAHAEQQQTENTKAIADLTKEIAQLTAIIAATRPIEQQTAAVKTQTVDTDAQAKEDEQIKHDVDEITKTAKNTKATPEDSLAALEAVKDLMAILSAHKDLWTIVAGIQPNIASFKQEIEEIKQQVARLKNVSNMPQ